MNQIAIVYPYLPHYRKAIFRKLSQSTAPLFTLISDSVSYSQVQTIDHQLSELEIERGGLRWILVKNIFIKKKWLWQKGILKISFSDQFDGFIFLGNPYFLSTWVAAFILKIRTKPVFLWTHGLYKQEKGLKRFIRKLYYRLADGLFIYENYARDLLIKEGFDPNKIHLIYNSLDYDVQKKNREKLSEKKLSELKSRMFKNNKLPQLIFVGRLTKQKKLYEIIEALNVLKCQGVDVNFIFVGEAEDPIIDMLKSLVNKYSLNDNVIFFGGCYEEDILYNLIASSDICISPGEVGLTAIHCLSYGTPVITHNNFCEQMPEFEAIKPGFSGDFFNQADILDLSNKIKNWLDTKTNREQIRKDCYEIIDTRYNPTFQMRVIINTLQEYEKNS